MPRTSPKIAFGLYALAIKQDATPTCPDVQTFSKVNDLITGNVTSKPYATFEPDFWLLDGGYKFKPATDAIVHVGLWSLSMSDENGDFAVPPALTVTFGSVQNADGLTLRFASYSVDYASDIDVAYYDASNVLIRTDNYTPTSWEFSTGQAVSDFKKIIITFNSTNKPYRYLRLTGIDFGELIYFTGADVKSAVVKQEIHPLSLETRINDVDIVIFSNDVDFSVINPSGVYANLQENQPIDVYETVDSEEIYIGRYYLKNWNSISENEIHLQGSDILGILENTQFLGGVIDIISDSPSVDAIVNVVLLNTNIPYEIDESLATFPIIGWIQNGSCREVLQQIAFACGGYIDTSRTGVLRILPTRLVNDLTEHDYLITRAEKSIDQSLNIKSMITDVELVYHNFYRSGEVKTLFSDTLAAGEHTITFQPSYDLGITGGTITTSSPALGEMSGSNFCIVNVVTPGTVTITGKIYVDTKSEVKISNNTLALGSQRNILRIETAYLVYANNVDEIAQRLYDYFQQRYVQKTKLFASSIAPGDSALIDTYQNNQLTAIVEKMEIDLAKGFVSKVEFIGSVVTP